MGQTKFASQQVLLSLQLTTLTHAGMTMILALDHSLCHTGWALYTNADTLHIGYYGRVTDKTRKHAVWADICAMAVRLSDMIVSTPGIHHAVLEAPNAARSEAAAASKFSVYALAGMLQHARLHIHYVTARQVKAAAGVPNTKDKQAVIDAMYKKYGKSLAWHVKHGKLTKARNEHMADALAVLTAYKVMEGL